jgi:hypothetical protein
MAPLARAQDARRKIVAGALALEHTIKNPGSEFDNRENGAADRSGRCIAWTLT